jgi:hypothetical protein
MRPNALHTAEGPAPALGWGRDRPLQAQHSSAGIAAAPGVELRHEIAQLAGRDGFA